jgi:hypothetical protein
MLTVVKPLNKKRANHASVGHVGTLLEKLLIEVVAANYRYFLHQHLNESIDGSPNAERWCWPPLLTNERQLSGLFANAPNVRSAARVAAAELIQLRASDRSCANWPPRLPSALANIPRKYS